MKRFTKLMLVAVFAFVIVVASSSTADACRGRCRAPLRTAVCRVVTPVRNVVQRAPVRKVVKRAAVRVRNLPVVRRVGCR